MRRTSLPSLVGCGLLCLSLSGCGEAGPPPEPPAPSAPLDWSDDAGVTATTVALVSGYSGCTGTFLASHWVLTAAHCLWDSETEAPRPADRVRVKPGMQVDQVFLHPSWRNNKYDVNQFDAALVHTVRPAAINVTPSGARFDPAALPPGTGFLLRPLVTLPADSLDGATLRCEGMGYLRLNPMPGPDQEIGGGDYGPGHADFVLRKDAMLADHWYRYVPNLKGQIQLEGDSGGGCFVMQRKDGSTDPEYPLLTLNSYLNAAGYRPVALYAVLAPPLRAWIESVIPAAARKVL